MAHCGDQASESIHEAELTRTIPREDPAFTEAGERLDRATTSRRDAREEELIARRDELLEMRALARVEGTKEARRPRMLASLDERGADAEPLRERREIDLAVEDSDRPGQRRR